MIFYQKKTAIILMFSLFFLMHLDNNIAVQVLVLIVLKDQ